MRICLFEDHAESLHPLTLTRPTFSLRCGLSTLADKILRHFQPREVGVLVRPGQAGIVAQEHPTFRINNDRWISDQATLIVNGRWLPPVRPTGLGTESCVGLVGNEVAFVKVSAEQLRNLATPNLPEFLEHWKNTLPRVEAGGSLVRYPWDLVEANGKQITQDFQAMIGREPSAVVSHLAVVGSRDLLWVHPSARIDPMVVVDTTHGPVVIERDANVQAFTRLEGPCVVGAGSHVMGAKVRGGTTIGPVCRVGGEVEASILHSHVNKYHEGFLGHSYVGAWVNLAAGTHTSDLRCDYGQVSMQVAGRQVLTGLRKIGSYIGDHSRTGLGVLLNTGTMIGAFCQVLPSAGLASRFIPSFTQWSTGTLTEGPALEEAFSTAQVVMQRRGETLTVAQRELYENVWHETAMERKLALRSWEQKRMRKVA